MQDCLKQSAICFVILRFSTSNRLFLLEARYLVDYWEKQEENGRKSIPLKDLEKIGYEMYYGLSPRIPYLSVVDQLIANIG